jgi:hypothetical protein
MQAGEPDVLGVVGTQTFVLGILGLVYEIPPSDFYGRPADPLIEVLPVLARGDRDAASRILAGYHLHDMPRSHDLEPLTFAALAFSELGPDEVREELCAKLLPLSGSVSVVGGAAACQGPVDFYLGRLAASLGRAEQAATHYSAARATARRLGAPAWSRVASEQLRAGNVFALRAECGDLTSEAGKRCLRTGRECVTSPRSWLRLAGRSLSPSCSAPAVHLQEPTTSSTAGHTLLTSNSWPNCPPNSTTPTEPETAIELSAPSRNAISLFAS